MHRSRLIVLLLFCSAALARGAEPAINWTIESPQGVEYDLATRTARVTNGVVVRYGDTILTAQQATLNDLTGEVDAVGEVRISHEHALWSGERVRYNFKTRRFIGDNFKTGQTPFFSRGSLVAADRATEEHIAANGVVATDDVAEPGYSVRAKTLLIVPGQYIEARHAWVYYHDTPVFYFPYYRRSLRSHPNYFEATPGYRNRFGPFLRSSYHWYGGEHLDGDVHVDGYVKRGVGLGPDLNWRIPRVGEGTFKYYYIDDNEPGKDPNGKPIDDERQRVYFFHQADITSNLTAKAMVRYQSDAFIVRDFFETEYKKNVQPSTFVEVDQRWSNFSLNLLVQPRVNDFFETVERLPDIKLTGLRQQIGATPLYYESDSSVGYYHRKFADSSTNLPFAAFRADTFHQTVLPWTFFNWLNVTPRVGGRYTHYSEANDSGATTLEQDRAVFNTGAEVSLKASRVWSDIQNRFWELDGLRHIVEPSINYAYVPRPNVPPHRLPKFDYELPTTRLLPIEFPDYNSIDSIDSQNVMRFGLRNKLQTKRAEGLANFLEWALYTDWRLRPRHDQTTFSDVYSDMDLKPFSWLTLTSELRYDLDGKQFDEANHYATLTPNDVWSLSLGHRYLREFPGFGPESGNNLILGTFYYRFNENWAARISEHFEARDGVLEEQQYTIYRDFRSWTGALTLRIRDQRSGPTDVTAAVTFSLKAFPRFKLGEDVAKPTLLLGS